MGRDGIAIGALALLGKPFDEARSITNLAPRLGQGLALLEGHEPGQIFRIFQHQIIPFAQDGRALLGGLLAPGRPCLVGGINRAQGLRLTHIRHGADHLTGRWVGHLKGLAAIGLNPVTTDKGLEPEQVRVIEFQTHMGGIDGVHGGAPGICFYG